MSDAALTIFESNDLLVMRRNRGVLALMISPFVSTLALAAAGNAAALGSLLPVALICAALTLLAYRQNWRATAVSLPVRADAEGVTLGGRLIPRSDLSGGLVLPDLSPRVVLQRRSGFSVELLTENVAEARSLLRALGFDASQTAADFHGLSWILTRPAFAVGALLTLPVMGLLCGKLGVDPILIEPVVLSLLALFLVPTRIRVGSDGIALRWLWVNRFVAHGEIEDVGFHEHTYGWRYSVVGLRIAHAAAGLFVPMTLRDRRALVNPAAAVAPELKLIWERIREAALVFHKGSAAEKAAASAKAGVLPEPEKPRPPP